MTCWKMERRVEIGGKYLQVDVAANYEKQYPLTSADTAE